MEGTHVIALNREQAEIVGKACQEAMANENLKTVYIIATTDPEMTRWFSNLGGADELEMSGDISSVFVGDVFTLAVDYEVTPAVLAEMGLE